jgi:hypothetical protein
MVTLDKFGRPSPQFLAKSFPQDLQPEKVRREAWRDKKEGIVEQSWVCRAGVRVLAAERTNDVPASAVNKAPGSTVRSQRAGFSIGQL